MTPRTAARARLRWLPGLAAVPVALSLAAIPASSVQTSTLSGAALRHLSTPVVTRYLLQHPEQAPAGLQRSYAAAARALSDAKGRQLPAAAATGSAPSGLARFNHDSLGLPQNEESVTGCAKRPAVVLGGTNDYRGLVNPEGNFTGWNLSTDGGRSVASEGLLPAVRLGGKPTPSGGDPVFSADSSCSLYAADLNYDLDTDFANPAAGSNGVGLYRTSVSRLVDCPANQHQGCWPTRRSVATNPAGHFLDKPWMTTGRSGSAGNVVWVVYTDFNMVNPAFPGLFTNQIKAVRCSADLSTCTQPILISGQQNSLQFGDVTVGADGRTYVTWEEDNDLANNFEPPEHMRFWLRVAEPGSTSFGPPRLVARAPLNLGIATLHANGFRASTYPKNTVAMVNGRPRVFLTWEECAVRVLGDSTCEEPQVKLRWSDDLGKSWQPTRVVSGGGDNYFPTIDSDPASGNVTVAYYTSRFDPVFHNRQDVEVVTVPAATGSVVRRQRVTPLSNEPEADPLLGPAFIGDYFEVNAQNGRAVVHFNANYTSIPLLGEGVPIPQQDNFVGVVHQ